MKEFKQAVENGEKSPMELKEEGNLTEVVEEETDE